MDTGPPIHEALREIRERLNLIYAENLESLILYGSHARGEAEPGSDIDLLLVLKDFRNAETELSRIDPIASELSLEHDVVITFLVVRSRDFAQRNTPLLLNVRREGIVL